MARYPRIFGSPAAKAQARAAVSVLRVTGAPVAATVGSSAAFIPAITGGTALFVLALASGALPGGRAISGTSVTGAYTTTGTFAYTLRVTDALGAFADLPITQTVGA